MRGIKTGLINEGCTPAATFTGHVTGASATGALQLSVTFTYQGTPKRKSLIFGGGDPRAFWPFVGLNTGTFAVPGRLLSVAIALAGPSPRR